MGFATHHFSKFRLKLAISAPRRPQILEAVANLAPRGSLDRASDAQKGRCVALAESA